MKSELMNEIRSVGLALAVISSLVQPAHAQEQSKEISTVEDKENYSISAAQLLAQTNNNLVNKVTGVQVKPTDKGIEVILASPNIEALKPVNKSQGNNFIVEIPNTVLSLGQSQSFNKANPAPGITSVSVTQTNANTIRLTVTGEKGLPKAELFDDQEGLIFELAPIAAATTPQPQSQATPSAVVQISEVKLNPTDKGLEIILATPEGDKLQVLPKKEENKFIADITSAQLTLPNGDTVSQKQPIAGISEITVTNLNTQTIRLAVIGEASLPAVELFDGDEGLIFAVTSTASTPQSEQPAATPSTPPETQTTPPPQSGNPTQPEQPTSSNESIELIVTGEKDGGYFIPEATTAAKVEAPIRDIPAAIQVIPKEVIEDQQVVRLNELANNVSGVQQQSGYGGLSSQGYFIRGFGSGFETLRNGFRNLGFTSPRDIANIERVEFLKGPASVLYGSASSPGGVVNTITKQPLSEPFYRAGFTIGSYDFYRPTIDLSGPLTEDKSVLYRLNAAYENAGSFRDFNENESFFVSPVITLNISPKTKLTFEYEYQKYDYTFDRGLLPGEVFFKLPISRFLGEPDFNQADFKSNSFAYNFEHQFGGSWKFRQGFNIINSGGKTQYVTNRRFAEPFLENDGRTLVRRAQKTDEEQQNISLQTEVSGKFKTGSIGHNFLFGVELANSTYSYDVSRAPIAGLDIFNPVYGAKPGNFTRSFSEKSGADNFALYIQDLIELSPNLKFLAGGRLDNVDSFYDDLVTNSNINKTSDSQFSPRLGIVYQPTNTTSLYGSWTNSFNPQFLGRSRTGEQFKPETSQQFEFGIKQELFDKRLFATLAYFDITKKNVLTPDPVDNEFSVQTGEQKSRGVELDITGEILPGWKVIATYAYADAFVSEDNEPLLVNNRLQAVPYNSASLWTTYEFQKGNLQGLGLGLGLVYVGEREATLPNSIKIPSYIRTDASIFYRRDNWRAAINIKNLLDNKYYESQSFYVVPGAPLTVLGTVSVDF